MPSPTSHLPRTTIGITFSNDQLARIEQMIERLQLELEASNAELICRRGQVAFYAGVAHEPCPAQPAAYRLDYTAGTVEVFHLTTPGSLQLDLQHLREDGCTNVRQTPLYRHAQPPLNSRGDDNAKD